MRLCMCINCMRELGVESNLYTYFTFIHGVADEGSM